EQADGGGNRRLRRPWRRPLDRGQRLERALVPDLAQRQRRVVLQRTVEFGDGDERVNRILCLVIAERLDDRAAEEIFATRHLADQRLSRAGDVVARSGGQERGEGADESGTDEFGLLL